MLCNAVRERTGWWEELRKHDQDFHIFKGVVCSVQDVFFDTSVEANPQQVIDPSVLRTMPLDICCYTM